jgi:F-type H+-transporting ATPase subunit c
MRTRKSYGLLLMFALVVSSTAAVAAPPSENEAEGSAAMQEATARPEGLSIGHAIAIVGACFGAGMCAIGGGYAIARIGAKCIEAIARQPEAAGAMFAPMIVSAAMVEGGMLFAIVVCLLGVLGL